jgi:hypothetical protein
LFHFIRFLWDLHILIDFLALESLLTLVGRLLPSAQGKGEPGRAKRSQFIHEVIDAMSLGVSSVKEIITTFESASSSPWEEVSAKILDILAQSNVSLYAIRWMLDESSVNIDAMSYSPQPFQLDCFRACDVTFPQPSLEDRLYVDQKSFYANVDQASQMFSRNSGPQLRRKCRAMCTRLSKRHIQPFRISTYLAIRKIVDRRLL